MDAKNDEGVDAMRNNLTLTPGVLDPNPDPDGPPKPSPQPPTGKDKNYDNWLNKCTEVACKAYEKGSIGNWCCVRLTKWACRQVGKNFNCCDCVKQRCRQDADETNPLEWNRCEAQFLLCMSGKEKL